MTIYQSRFKDTEITSVDDVRILTEKSTYLDAISGIFNVPFGYSCQSIKNSICQAVNTLPFHPKEHFYSSDIFTVADKLLNRTGLSGGALLFLNSGSEAIEAALAIALDYHKAKGNHSKQKIITRRYSYHGATLGAHSVTGRNDFSELRGEGYQTIRINPPFEVVHNGKVISPWDVDSVRETIELQGPDNIAAILFEPVNHLKGMHQSPGEYIRGIRSLCDEFDILMITDEIVTGACRTGTFLNTHQFGVTPDIVALGKGISGGYYPSSVMATSSKVSSVFSTKGSWIRYSYSHTYAGNPVSIAAVKAGLSELDNLEASGRLQELSKLMKFQAAELAKNEGIIRVDVHGLLLGITLHQNFGFNSGKRLENLCHKHHVVIRGDENWACIVPAYVMSNADLRHIFEVVNEAVNELSSYEFKVGQKK